MNHDSKFLNFKKVLFQGMFYIVCVFGRDRQNLCKYGWDNLFWKSSIVKGCGEPELYASFESYYAVISKTVPEADVSPRVLQAEETPGLCAKGLKNIRLHIGEQK
ncbi:unnamed protein product [Rhizophagus irregularis]|nr:unnamed protein product [Rhizophagus irregularis]CAB5216286.1 unnamed protein product [Rhizophagus irregularis]